MKSIIYKLGGNDYMVRNKINELTHKYLKEIIYIRRDIHAYPELGMNEYRTSELIYNELNKLDLEVEKGIGKTGVVALLEGEKPGKTLLLRADMDALPIEETTDLPFKSKNKGVMHACGHDVHTSVLLGAAKVLVQLKSEIKGNVKFIFQPAEECNPIGGANLMIEDGVLENPKVDAAVALHVWDLPLGKIGIRHGAMMAQSDRIFIKIKGKSAHGSAPHQGTDTILTAGYVITALQSIVSRNVNPLESAVITLGIVNGGYRYNVIADEVSLEGTVRTFDKDVAEIVPIRIKEVVEGISNSMECQCEVEYVRGYPLTHNNKELTDIIIKGLENTLGEDNVIMPEKPATGAEDFSFFNKHVPCTFMWIGCKSEENKDNCIVHNPNFICDERSIEIGIKALCASALEYLK
ncbi:amidohydrolase [Clostridium tetani]|nr:amidohydrolase [Clostridium tetani]